MKWISGVKGVAVVGSRTELPVVPRFRAWQRFFGQRMGASEHHSAATEERYPSCKARPRRLRLSDKFFPGLFGALLEVLAGLDDDRRISILNPNVVHLPKSRPGTPINDFWKFHFHCLLVS